MIYCRGQKPTLYKKAWRRFALEIERNTEYATLLWAPNEGGGYPYGGDNSCFKLQFCIAHRAEHLLAHATKRLPLSQPLLPHVCIVALLGLLGASHALDTMPGHSQSSVSPGLRCRATEGPHSIRCPGRTSEEAEDCKLLDTNNDGKIDMSDDPFMPYWPGEEAVDWVGMSVFHFGVGGSSAGGGHCASGAMRVADKVLHAVWLMCAGVDEHPHPPATCHMG
jgi:hypothetical protein